MNVYQLRHLFLLKAMVALATIAFFKPMFASELPAASKPIEHQVVILSFKFEPNVIKVKAGDSISWLNKDIVPHTATASDKSWDTGIIETNQTKTIMIEGNFTTSYICLYHPMMKAKLEIIIDD